LGGRERRERRERREHVVHVGGGLHVGEAYTWGESGENGENGENGEKSYRRGIFIGRV